MLMYYKLEKERSPTTNSGMQKWKLSRNRYTLHARCFFFARLMRRLARAVGACRQNFCIGAQQEVCQECVAGLVGCPS